MYPWMLAGSSIVRDVLPPEICVTSTCGPIATV